MDNNPKIKSLMLNHDANTSVFLEAIEKGSSKSFVVIDNDEKFLGIATEGDLRRYIINNKRLPEFIHEFVNYDAFTLSTSDVNSRFFKFFDHSNGVTPVVNANLTIKDIISGSYEHDKLNARRKSVNVIAPTRITFAGGGSDISTWFSSSKGCVVNLAITKYARVQILKTKGNLVNLFSQNTNEKLSLKLSEIPNYSDSKLLIVVECLKLFKLKDGIDIEIFCDFDPGTGLGGSSSLVVALLKGLTIINNINIDDQNLYELAYEVERNKFGCLGGWQDQIASVKGGLNIINFASDGIKSYKMHLSEQLLDKLNSCFFISKVGIGRESSVIHLFQQAAASEINYIQKMKKIVNIANDCVKLFGNDKIDAIGEILHEGWLLKRELGDFISNPDVDKQYENLLSCGSSGGKLLGAGGTGYILSYVSFEKQSKFLKACKSKGLKVERIAVDITGCREI